MRALKIAGYVLGAVLALVVLLMVGVVLFVDPNDYRADIERIVERETGRQLTLGGELKLSVFPWLALQTGPASLSDAPGFGDEPFVSLQNARVSVRVLPLLRGSVQVGNVSLTGARIRLLTDSQGRDNWADLGKKDAAEAPAATAQGPAQLPTIAGLEIKDAAVVLDNRQTNSRRVIRDFNLETGRLQSGEPFDLKLGLIFDQDASLSVKVHVATTVTADLESNAHRLAKPEIDVTISGPGYPAEGVPVRIRADSLSTDIGRKIHRLDGFDLTTAWKGDGLPAGGVPVALKAKELTANLAAQTLELTDLQAEVAGARLSGALKGEEILDAPRIGGPLRLEPVSLREWLPKLGVAVPKTRDAEVLKRLSFASNVAATRTSAELQDVNLQFDETTAKGSLGIADFASKALRFDLNVDRIDADRYLPPPVDAPVPAKTDQEPPANIPIEALRNLNARGQLQVEEAVFANIKFTKLRLGVNARDGKVRFNPSEASMYGGQYRGDIGIDATTDVARISLDEHLSGIDFAPLFSDLFESKRVAGKGSANIKLRGSGRNTHDIVKTLAGNLDFAVANGAVEGADLWYEIRRARAVLKQEAAPERTGPERTEFSALKGTGVMQNGVLTNNDLDVSLQYLKVTGQGKVDVPNDTLDYQLIAKVLKIPGEGADAAQMQELVDASIPVKVTGTLSDPKVRPDIEGYLKGKVKQRVEEERGKVEQKIKDKLGDKLKDLLGR
jgi:AsmA protein